MKIIITSILLLSLSFELIAKDKVKINNTYTSIGIGANYGGLFGVTINNKINDKFEFFTGLGGITSLGYVVGGRFYINDNMRLIANYGTNSTLQIIKENILKTKFEDFEGVNFGFDIVANNGFNMGLMFIDTSNLDNRVNELKKQGLNISSTTGKIKFSIGYNF